MSNTMTHPITKFHTLAPSLRVTPERVANMVLSATRNSATSADASFADQINTLIATEHYAQLLAAYQFKAKALREDGDLIRAAVWQEAADGIKRCME